MFGFITRIFGGHGGAAENPYETPMGRGPANAPSAPSAPESGSSQDPSSAAEQAIARAIASKQMILAIKLVRQHSGAGLAESKRAIERGTWRSLLRE